MNKLTPDQKAMIARMKKEAQKAITKIIAMTLDANLRHQRIMECNMALSSAIQRITAH